MNVKFPKYAIGREWPERNWPDFIVRLRNPLTIALIEEADPWINLHVWPDIRSQTTDTKLERIMSEAVRIASDELGDGGDFRSWSYAFGTLNDIPRHLFLDSTRGDWRGILRIQNPMSLWQVDAHWRSATLVQWFGPAGPTEEILRGTLREVSDYLDEFRLRFDLIDDEDYEF